MKGIFTAESLLEISKIIKMKNILNHFILYFLSNQDWGSGLHTFSTISFFISFPIKIGDQVFTFDIHCIL